MATYLEENSHIERVYYPGLKSHPQHELAKSQMHGFGAMLSFELERRYRCDGFSEQSTIDKAFDEFGRFREYYGKSCTNYTCFISDRRTFGSEGLQMA